LGRKSLKTNNLQEKTVANETVVVNRKALGANRSEKRGEDFQKMGRKAYNWKNIQWKNS
jgi:hypothetical protein